MNIKYKKLYDSAVTPTKAKYGDAGFDLTVTSIHYDDKGNLVCNTGLAFEIPYGYVGLLFPRSSCADKSLILSNCVGVIDAGYRGEVSAKFKLLSMREVYKIGERCCQMVIVKLPDVEMVEVDELSDSERGCSGYGSTGK